MIKHISFKHGWFYHYRVHTQKLEKLSTAFPDLQTYLLRMFEECPHEHFQSGPRSSKLKISLPIEMHAAPGHEVCSLAKHALATGRYKTGHSNVQVGMLEQDAKTVAVEVPLWLESTELPRYQDLFADDRPLTGHIDLVSIENNKVWIWDYKPNAHKEKYAHVQTYLYAIMLNRRTGIPLDQLRCGYFDDTDCFVFTPPKESAILSILQ